MPGSKVFCRNRALGFVTNHVPASVRYLKKRKLNFVITCIGRSFHTYECNHFRLIAVSGQHPEDISALASDKRYVYSAAGNEIYAWRSTAELKHTFKGHEDLIHILLPFGQHLISVDQQSVLKVWEIEAETVYWEMPFDNNAFKVTCVMHPATYLNKILVGSDQGGLQLWNIKEGKLIHTFNTFDSSINVIEPAPANDVVAIGLQNGDIKLLNLKFDEILMEFKQDWGPVTGISFRTDGKPIMCSSSSNGNVVFWNLEERKVASQITAHFGSVTTLQCLPSEPLLITTSPDNSLRMWIFDMPDEGARLIRFREGHSAPPTCVRYHGQKGLNILSAGEDSSLRVFNTISEKFNKSMGRASYNKKSTKRKNRFEEDIHIMPPIREFTTELTREKEWDNIAAIHSGLPVITSWSFDKCRMGDLQLMPPVNDEKGKSENLEATCIALTNCGNFVVVGYSNGRVERFNIQSGIHRATYGNWAHKFPVRGIVCDGLNQFICSGGSDGTIKYWNFKGKTTAPIGGLKMDDGIVFFRNHRESGMLAVALESYEVHLMDCDTRHVTRKFKGHKAPITDCCFSPDSRWLITAAMDSTIKIWDIPSSYMIDHFRLENACVSLTMSPSGDFLATAHIEYLGVFLWSNKTLFDHITLRSIDPESEPPMVDLATFSRVMEEVDEEEEVGDELHKDYSSPEQLDEDLLTMSESTATRWHTLLNLDVIKQRNRAKVPIKKEKNAPFFLPTISGLETKFDLPDKEQLLSSRIIVPENFNNYTTFGKILAESVDNFDKAIEHFTKLGPSMTDMEIRSMDKDSVGSIQLLDKFMKMLIVMLKSNKNFEVVQAYLAVFLKTHGPELTKHSVLRTHLAEIETLNEQGWQRLEKKLFYGLGVVSALRNFVK